MPWPPHGADVTATFSLKITYSKTPGMTMTKLG